MSVLIVGGDRVAPAYLTLLASSGFAPVRHWSGRKPGECHREIPQDTRVVVLLVDQVNHSLARKIRKTADQRALPIVFCQRSLNQLASAIDHLGD